MRSASKLRPSNPGSPPKRPSAARAALTLALLLVPVLAISACTGPWGETDTIERNSAVVVATGTPFFSYNDATSYGHSPGNTAIREATASSFNSYDEHGTLVPDSSFGSYRVLSTHPFTVRYTIRDGVRWSDGAKVDAADLLLAWAANSGALNTPDFDPAPYVDAGTGRFTADFPRDVVFFDGATSAGLSQVSTIPQVSDDARSITLRYDNYVPDWQLLLEVGLPAHIVAEHALAAKDASTAKSALITAIQHRTTHDLAAISRFWNSGFNLSEQPGGVTPVRTDQLLSTGPYTVTDFSDGDHVTLTANPKYAGHHKPHIEKITVRFITDPLSQAQALRERAVDVVAAAGSADLAAALHAIPGARVVAGFADDYEHVDLQFARSRSGSFDNPMVREAFLKVVPRREILRELVAPVHPHAPLRSSWLFLPGAAQYSASVAANGSDAFDDVDVVGAQRLLAQAAVEHPSVCVLFDSGNPRRKQEFTLLQAHAQRAGFVVSDCSSPDWANLLGTAGAYDAALFAWSESNSATGGAAAVFGTDGARNYNFYSSQKTDALLAELGVAADPARQAELRQAIDEQLFRDAYGVPLYQFPQLVATGGGVNGLTPSARAAGILWNAWKWTTPNSR
ncbi:ABC transporter family substrate-binding protein [Parafrigoribacterium mesophilum]|uniref:ABC transporter substrate-binding protein n=1 Tax=Parafrigoribacterium mesophilum TaxID=433646 RepID=UPI0031FDD6B7